jgi:PAP2 superfamily
MREDAAVPEDKRTISIALAILVAVAVVTLALRLPLSPYLVFAFAAASLLHALDRPSRAEWLLTLVSAAVLAAARMATRHDLITNATGLYAPLTFLGMGTLLVTAVPLAWLRGERRRARLEKFVHRAALPFMAIMAGVFVARTSQWLPVTYDAYLYAFDWSYGLQLSFVLGRWFERFAWLQKMEYVVYFGLPLGLALAAGRTRLYSTGRTLLIFLVAGVIGFALYTCMPAAGPAYLFPNDYPDQAPLLGTFTVRPMLLAADAPRNAMPSLHFAWTVLAFWNSRRSSSLVRVTIAVFTVLTFLATLGWGQHYLVDLIVAVPFSLTVQALCAPLVPRQTRVVAAWFGAVVTATWILFLRIAPPQIQLPMLLTWLLSALTVAISVWFYRRLPTDRRP